MQSKLKSFAFCVAVLGLGLFSSSAFASATNLGTSLTPIGTDPAGTETLLTTITQSYVLVGSGGTGTVTEQVWANYSNNPFGSGFLSFVFSVQPDPGDVAVTISSNGFLGFNNAGIVDPGNGSSVSGSVSTTPSGTLTLTYSPQIDGGSGSPSVVLNTNATSVIATVINVIDGGVGISGPFVAPSNGGGPGPHVDIPEPTSMALCASCFLCLGGLGAWRRRGLRPSDSSVA